MSVEIYAVYPKAHRSAVTEVDPASPPPADTIDARHSQKCRFDVALTGVALTLLTVQPIFWDEATELWVETAETKSFTAVGDYTVVVDAGAGMMGFKISLGLLFLRITAFTGTSFSFSADYLLS